jgi:hypothetical protein
VSDKDIIIGRVINVTGMIGVSAGIVLLAFGIILLSSCYLSELYYSYFGVALASILQTPFTGFGSWRAGPLRASAMRPCAANNSELNEHKLCF